MYANILIPTDGSELDTPVQFKARMHEHAEKTLGIAAAAAQIAGVACETVQVEHGISAIVLGSETVKVLTHCEIPVLVHR
jgi:nucleotide-binding universal stress UspA family protein